LKEIQIGDESISGTDFIDKYVGEDGRIGDKKASEALKAALRKNANENE